MRREQLEHVLRAASQIAGDPDVLVIGSQSVLGAIPEERLPAAATASIEVDLAFFDDPDDRKAAERIETVAVPDRASAATTQLGREPRPVIVRRGPRG